MKRVDERDTMFAKAQYQICNNLWFRYSYEKGWSAWLTLLAKHLRKPKN